MKRFINLSPILELFDPIKPVFLKTGRRAEIIACILMQPSDNKCFVRTTKILLETVEFLFKL